MSGEQHVTLDWGTPKVHLASGRKRIYGSGETVEEALCGYVRHEAPREDTEDADEFICRRCLKKRDHQEEAQR